MKKHGSYFLFFAGLISWILFSPGFAQEFSFFNEEVSEEELEEGLRDPGFQQFLKNLSRTVPEFADLKIAESTAMQPQTTLQQDGGGFANTLQALDWKLKGAFENLRACEKPGYKRRKFETFLESAIPESGAAERLHLEIRADFSPGEALRTDRELDVMIEGEGFFKVFDPLRKEFLYTRNGEFEIDGSRQMVQVQGNRVRSLVPSISLPGNIEEIRIESDGKIKIRLESESEEKDAGTLALFRFRSPGRLKPVDDLYFLPTEFSGPARKSVPRSAEEESKTGFTLRAKHLESSNANPISLHNEIREILQQRETIRGIVPGKSPNFNVSPNGANAVF